MNPIEIQSFSKVNIGLRILGTRPDGYHTIETVYQELDFGDRIRIEKNKSGFHIDTNADWVPTDETNTCHKAYRILKSRFPRMGGISVFLDKSVPAGAGLGGGSANAAAMLKFLNEIFRLGCSETRLENLAFEVGADVPFFIRGGTQVGTGAGDRLTLLEGPVNGVYLLVLPSLSISTGWAYRAVKNTLEASTQLPNFAGFFNGGMPSLKIFKNDFEDIVIPAYPEIGVIKQQLLDAGAGFASLSGSGSTVYGIFDDEATAKAAESTFNPPYKTILARPTNL